MDTTDIATSLAPYLGTDARQISPSQLDQISAYIDLLLHWNSRINLTAIRDPGQIVTRHFGESLFAARCLFPSIASPNPGTLADIGSGTGFPGIPIKLWNPGIRLTLIESNHKKAAFLREVLRTLGMDQAEVQTVRAETIADKTFDLATLRAVERMTDLLPTAAKLLTPRGRIAIFLTSSKVKKLRSSNFNWQPPIPIPQSDSRVLLLGTNQGSTQVV